jgi:hypothetical protein
VHSDSSTHQQPCQAMLLPKTNENTVFFKKLTEVYVIGHYRCQLIQETSMDFRRYLLIIDKWKIWLDNAAFLCYYFYAHMCISRDLTNTNLNTDLFL